MDVRPFRLRKGFKDFAYKVPGTDIIAGAQIAVIAFPAGKGTQHTVVFVALHLTAAVICQLAGVPCTDV